MTTKQYEMADGKAAYQLPPVEIFERMADEAAPAISEEEVERMKSIIIKATEGTNAKVSELKFGIASDKLPRRVKVTIPSITVKAGCSYDEWRITLQPRTRGKSVTREDLETIIYGVFNAIGRYGHASVSTDREDCQTRSHRCLVLQINRDYRKFLSLRRAFESEAWKEADGVLPFVVGEGVGRRLVTADLAALPHLLVGGATAQGKSVFLHGIIASLLCRQRPEDVKLLLVDTKDVEFDAYARLGKAFLAQMPDGGDAIIDGVDKPVFALNSLCAEIKLRSTLMAKAEAGDLTSYNAAFASGQIDAKDGHRHLPRIIMVIDEYADIVMTHGRAIETMVCDLAESGHEVGIHIIIATQRPTIQMVTSKIKDAFPACAAFRVAQSIDSRTLIDAEGAEVLTGMGDMIFCHADSQERLQAPYVSPADIDRLVDYVRKACDAAGCGEGYALPMPSADDDKSGGIRINGAELDPLFDEASRFAKRAKGVTVEKLQLKFVLGYNRATRLLKQLVDAGIVSDEKQG